MVVRVLITLGVADAEKEKGHSALECVGQTEANRMRKHPIYVGAHCRAFHSDPGQVVGIRRRRHLLP